MPSDPPTPFPLRVVRPPVNHKLAHELNELLAQVLSGEVVGAAFAAVRRDNTVEANVSDNLDKFLALGALARLVHVINAMMDEEARPLPPAPPLPPEPPTPGGPGSIKLDGLVTR